MAESLMDTRRECFIAFGIPPDSTPDMELTWLRSNGATSTDRMGAWMEFLAIQGFPEGAFPDPRFAWLRSFGYLKSTQDMLAQYWKECPSLVVLSEYTNEYTNEFR